MATRQRPITRRKRAPAPLPWRDIGQVALLILAIIIVWYLAWGRYRHQPPPQVRYHFQRDEAGRIRP
jgi:hypothetical protein